MNSKVKFLSYSIGLIYILFGSLKFFPHISPAETIGIVTVQNLTFDMLSPTFAIYSLAILEVVIGILLFTKNYLKIGVIAALIHLIFTFTPFIFSPNEAFATEYFTPSLLGQYILKNIILIGALWVIYPSNEESKILQQANA